MALDDPRLLDAAIRCASKLIDVHIVDGRLRRTSGWVVGDSPATLEDHAALATGLLALYQLTGEPMWLGSATGLVDLALSHFADERPGRWFDSADDAERLVVRPADPIDGATPSGASLLAEALLTAERGRPGCFGTHRRGSRRDIACAFGTSGAAPRSAGALAGGGRGRGARPTTDSGGL